MSCGLHCAKQILVLKTTQWRDTILLLLLSLLILSLLGLQTGQRSACAIGTMVNDEIMWAGFLSGAMSQRRVFIGVLTPNIKTLAM